MRGIGGARRKVRFDTLVPGATLDLLFGAGMRQGKVETQISQISQIKTRINFIDDRAPGCWHRGFGFNDFNAGYALFCV
jgi:hypothetical protein